ncbi:ESPR-type extended signal peptide-containing protein [Alcaligenes sp. Marseille-Q7550]
MNKVYKSIWSEQTGTFVAVAENTKARGKRSTGTTMGMDAAFGPTQGLSWKLGAVMLALLSAGLLARPAAAQAVDGWDLSVDNGAAFHVAPGGAFALNSGSNIALTQNNGEVTVALNPDLPVDSVTATGAIKGATGEFTGQLSAGSAVVQGNLQADSATVANQLTAGSAIINGAVQAHQLNASGVTTGTLTATGASSLRAVNVNNNKISGLADGVVSATSTEAISGKVLYNALNSGNGMKYFHANSTKADSTAGGTDAIAIGPQASAAGEAALAAGLQAQAAGKETGALGARGGTGNTGTKGVSAGRDAGTGSTGAGLVALGNQAGQQIAGSNNVAIGSEAGKATSPLDVDNTVAIGNKAMAKADNAVAIGNQADVALLADNGVALGNGAVITQDGVSGTALGSGASVHAASGTALGAGARAGGAGATALGATAQASGGASLAGGSGARAVGSNSVALGAGAVSNTQSGVAIGEGAGANSSSPVVGNRFGHVSVGGLSGQNVSGGYNVAMGYKAGSGVTGDDTVSIGREAGQSLTGERTISIGYGANYLPGQTGTGDPLAPAVNAQHAVAIGERSRSGADSSVALGSKATVADYDIGGIAIGNQALVYAGTATQAAGGGVALGDKARVTHSNSVAIGANSQSVATTGAGYGAPSGAFLPSSSVSFGTVNGERRLSNVAAGRLDTDAVNVSQLKQLHGNLESVIGGNLDWDANGVMTGPVFTIRDENGVDHNYSSVGSALQAMRTGVADAVTGLNAVTYSNTDRTLIDLDSATGAPVRITNVAAGTAASDAVNKGQLDSLESSLMEKRMRYVSVNSPNSNPNINNDGATGSDAIAIGPIARASGDGSTSIGLNSTAGGLLEANLTTALGANTAAVGLGATAVGAGAASEAEGAIAMGQGARTADNANFAVALGHNSEVMADANEYAHGGIAIGDTARVNRLEGIAMGRNAYDEGIRGTAIGVGAHVTKAGKDSQALGTGATVSGSSSTALGVNANVAGSSSLAMGAGSSTRSNNSVGVGSASTAPGHRSVAVGDKANTGWVEEVDLGNDGKKYVYHGAEAIGIGADSDAHEDRSMAVGAGAKAMQADASALGSNAQALAGSAQAWGTDARASAQNSIAIGNGAVAGTNAANGIALGAGSAASAAGAVALGAGSTTAASYSSSVSAYTNITNQEAIQGVVSVGNGSQNRRITNLAGGQADTDAVNVAQLKKLDDVLTTRGTNYSGNNYNAANTGTTIHKDLGQRLEILGGATTAGNYSGANVRTQAVNGQLQIQFAETPHFKGADMGGQKITNVADGTVSSTSKDAVNGSQLYQVENKPITFQGNTGSTPRKLGETQVIKGTLASSAAANTSNIRTSVNSAGEMEILLANNLTADSLTINNGGPVINGGGINMGGKQITNLADGTQNDHAVNLGQLKDVEATANAGWNLGTNGDPAARSPPAARWTCPTRTATSC